MILNFARVISCYRPLIISWQAKRQSANVACSSPARQQGHVTFPPPQSGDQLYGSENMGRFVIAGVMKLDLLGGNGPTKTLERSFTNRNFVVDEICSSVYIIHGHCNFMNYV